jgi:hypothetical protein
MPLQFALSTVCHKVVVIAYREDVRQLVSMLVGQGFDVRVQRGKYSDEETQYSRSCRCLMNHAAAWRAIAAGTDQLTIVVEADFVPCRRFADLRAPFPVRRRPLFAWLYSAGSILYGIDQEGFPYGHGNTTVAYVLSREAAAALQEFYEEEIARTNLRNYISWEKRLGKFLRRRKDILNHIPMRQFGEHGGLPNPEHKQNGKRDWHQADMLAGPLAFQPLYASNNRIRYRAIRLRGWLRGWFRVMTLRFFDPRHTDADTSRGRARLAVLSVSRLLPFAGSNK